ncbi:MAG: TolC family protein, partial [Mucilaginibacter sp.]
MSIKKLGCLVFCLIAFTACVQAQTDTVLSLKDAVGIALKNNYHIQLSKNNTTVAQNNVTLGNAGFLPQVNGTFTTTHSIQNTTQTRSDGTTNVIHGANNASTSYGPSLNWTIFNGFGMFANYDALKQYNQLSQVQSRDTIQSTIASVIETYYNLINLN